MKGLALATTGVVAAVAVAAVAWPVAPAPPAAPAAAATPWVAPAVPPAAVPAVAVAPAPAAAATPRCAGETLTVQHRDGTRSACLGPARLVQHGDLRTWQAEAPPWRLEVVLEGEDVRGARLLAAGTAAAACEGTACRGIALGPRDGHGQRRLRLQHAPLASGGLPLTVSGTLALQEPADACGDDALEATHERGGAWRFCASAASAVALLDDGRRLFDLRSQAGDVLQVLLQADGALASLSLGAWRCSAWACSGATLAPAAEGGMTLVLTGVPLLNAGAALRLQGRLQLPAP